MKQTLNLNRYLGRNSTDAQKILFAELAVEQINERTLDGDTIHGTKFKKYSESYANDKGVTRDSVDLFLDGDMLDSVRADIEGNSLDIEVHGSLNNAKGFNHNTGDTLPKRQWFGITTKEAKSIGEKVKRARPSRQSRPTLADLREALAVLKVGQS